MFQAATDFIVQHQIAPVVLRVLDGLEATEEGFELRAREEDGHLYCQNWTKRQPLIAAIHISTHIRVLRPPLRNRCHQPTPDPTSPNSPGHARHETSNSTLTPPAPAPASSELAPARDRLAAGPS